MIFSEVTGAPLVVQRARTELKVMSSIPGIFKIEDRVLTAPRLLHFEFMVVSEATAFTCTWYNWLNNNFLTTASLLSTESE
jgi:hypothetical protein